MRALKVVLLLAALGLMIFALAGPRWGSHYQEVTQKGVDIVLLADVSPSMLVEDVKPNRLERARREIHDFLKVVQGDRVGLVAFSGAAYVQCPLTLDYAALEMFLQALSPELIPTAGTDLGAAIETGLSAFDPKAETDKVMLLITDGEDNEGRGLEAARKAAEKGVKIFVFGVGEAGGGPVPGGGQGGFKKDEQGNMVLSRMDEESLREIAADTGGTYVRSVAGDLDLDVLYFDGIRSRTTAQTLKSGKIRIEEERFFLFLLPAFLLLLVEGFLAERRAFRPTVLLALLLAGSLAVAGRARAGEDPDQLFRKGRYAEAEKAYADLDMDHPKDVRYRYNRGCAAYQQGRLPGGDRGVLQRDRPGRRRRHAFQGRLQPRERRFPAGGFRGGGGPLPQRAALQPGERGRPAQPGTRAAQAGTAEEGPGEEGPAEEKQDKDGRRTEGCRRQEGRRRKGRRREGQSQQESAAGTRTAARQERRRRTRTRTSPGSSSRSTNSRRTRSRTTPANPPPPPRTGGWRRRC